MLNLGSVFSRFQADLRPLKKGIEDARKILSEYAKGANSSLDLSKAGSAKSQLKSIKAEIPNMIAQFRAMRSEGVGALTALVRAGAPLAGLLKGAAIAAGVLVAARLAVGLKDLATKAVLASESVKGLRISLVAAAGGVLEGNKAFQFARTLAGQLALDLKVTADSYKGVLAAVKAGGNVAEAAEFAFKGISIGMRALNLDGERSKAVLRAVSQIFSKGRVQSEELRQQLGEHLPNAIAFMAKGLGVSTGKLAKMMELGELTSEAMLDLSAQFQKSMGAQAQAAARSLTANMQRLKNSAFETLAALGEGGLTTATQAAVAALMSLLALAKEMVPVFEILLAPVVALAQGLSFLTRLQSGLVLAFIETKNQIGSLISNMLGLSTVADVIGKSFFGLGGLMGSVFEKIGELAGSLADKLGKFLPQQIRESLNAVRDAFTKGFQGGERSEFIPDSTKDIEKTLQRLKAGFNKDPNEKKILKERRDSLAKQRADLQAMTRARSAERQILQNNLSLDLARKNLALGSQEGLNATIANLQEQGAIKQRLIEFDRETLRAEIARLSAMNGITQAEKSRIAGQIAAKQIKLQELGIAQQLAAVELQTAVVKERQKDAQEAIKEQARFELESLKNRQRLEIERLKQRGVSSREIQQAELTGEGELLRLKKAQLEVDLATAQARGLNVRNIRNELALLGQNQALLNAQQQTFDLEPGLESAREFSRIITGSVRSFTQDLARGTADISRTFDTLGQALIDQSLKPLFDQIQQSLQQTFSQIGSSLGGLGGALFGGILIGLSSLFNRQKSQTRALADEVKGNIEQIETVRGLVAGQSNIAVAELSDNLSEAFRPTNDLLRSIDRNLADLAGRSAVGGIDPFSLNILSSSRV